MSKQKRSAVEIGEDYIPLDQSSKKARFFDESASEEELDFGEAKLSVNEEFARRFEHNKKRAELHRLEEKYGSSARPNGRNNYEDDEDEGSSSDETEDDEAVLATEALDADIAATLKAIRTKDPKVYDKNITFFNEQEEETVTDGKNNAEDKPMYLRDYHRKNLLNGTVLDEEDEHIDIPYAQQQRALKQSIINEMHAAAEEGDAVSDEDGDGERADGDNLFKRVKKSNGSTAAQLPDLDLAERDPETFLSNFLASRAWVQSGPSGFAALESDDSEDDVRADAFEEYYNLRFEDPELANQKLVSYARDAVAARTVRREKSGGRKKAREKERERKEAEKQERDEERAHLRKLKMEEMEEKVKRIRDAAGVSGRTFNIEEWTDMLEADWDDDQWDNAMKDRFGEDYYAQGDAVGEASDDEDQAMRKKPKKPKWDDDVDINDLVPDFQDDLEEDIDPELRLTDDEDDGGVALAGEYPIDGDSMRIDEGGENPAKPTKKRKQRDHKAEKADAKAAHRRDKRIISALVDQNLPLDIAQPGSRLPTTAAAAASSSTSKRPAFTPFRYRDTSPEAFGMTPLDILGATDAQLNEFAGLKKLAAFRDESRKNKDRKKLGKKGRLRQWRKDTFGDEAGADFGRVFGAIAAVAAAAEAGKGFEGTGGRGDGEAEAGLVDIVGEEGERTRRKKKRGKKGKGMDVDAV